MINKIFTGKILVNLAFSCNDWHKAVRRELSIKGTLLILFLRCNLMDDVLNFIFMGCRGTIDQTVEGGTICCIR